LEEGKLGRDSIHATTPSESPDAALYLPPDLLFEKCLPWFIKSEEEPLYGRF
jgi:hypothetical protein